MKPILFNTEMVRAILKGKKTTTRRIIKNVYGTKLLIRDGEYYKFGNTTEGNAGTIISNINWCKQPYSVGDILYVRETWCKGSLDYQDEKYYYKADNNNFLCKWHPSIHMPKEAARIFLKVTDVRVERLQDIDDDGAKAEGSNVGIGIAEKMREGAIDRFKRIWDSTLKKDQIEQYGWNANPWVWVIEFERVEGEE